MAGTGFDTRVDILNRTCDPWTCLAGAIVLRAVEDWRSSAYEPEYFSNHERRGMERGSRDQIEKFFRSRWFGCICTLDPELLIRRLRAEDHS